MKIQYASDLHLEFPENSNFIENNPIKVTGEILILAGDIHVFNSEKMLENPFWDWASKNYKLVIIAFGNHEFYKDLDLKSMENGKQIKIRDNVIYYYNCVIKLDENIDIIVSTLWSYIHKENEKECESRVNDFNLIKYGNEKLNSEYFNKEHEKCLNFLKKSVKESKAKIKIVVTHHVPSLLLQAKEFMGSKMNDAFTVDLTNYIKNSNIQYWIYGHSHRNINKIIGNTNCLCNQIGYIFTGEHKTFNNEINIDLTKNQKTNT